MRKIHNQTLVVLSVLALTSLFGCYYSNTFFNADKSVKIIVKGLDKIHTPNDIQVHLSGVNLDINEDPTLDNYFSITETYQNVSDLMKGLEIKSGKLSQGKWRIAIELIGWKTACSTFIEDKKATQLIFSYQEHLCP